MFDLNYTVEIMKKICETPSPSGFTKKVMKLIAQEFEGFGMQVSYNAKGALITFIEGKNEMVKKALAAHADTLGAMVKEIKSNGKISFTNIGGYMGNSVECENCMIHTSSGSSYTGTIYINKPSVHVHGDCRTLERSLDNMEILLDEKVASKEEVLALGIDVGDFISFDPRFKYTEKGFIKSRHLDDKASVAIILGVCKYIKESNIKPENTIQIIITNYEEVGHGAASGILNTVEELLCVDMGAPGQGQNTDEFTVSICAKDSSGPYDFEFRNKLITLAKNNNIDYRVDIYPHYASDGSAALKAGMNIRVGLIGAGVYASHSYERTHIESVKHTGNLLIEYIKE